MGADPALETLKLQGLIRRTRQLFTSQGLDLSDPENRKAWRSVRRNLHKLDEEHARQVLLTLVSTLEAHGAQRPGEQPVENVDNQPAPEATNAKALRWPDWEDCRMGLFVGLTATGFGWSLKQDLDRVLLLGILSFVSYVNFSRDSKPFREGTAIALGLVLGIGAAVACAMATGSLGGALIVAVVTYGVSMAMIPTVKPPESAVSYAAEVPSGWEASDEFLEGYPWRRLRTKVLRDRGPVCECCGATPAHGVRMNVDHIKPRKYFPELALDEDNLQVLCEVCNHGKGNWDQTDWRRH